MTNEDKAIFDRDKENTERYIVPILQAIFSKTSQQALADLLEIKPNHLAKIKSDSDSFFPKACRDRIIELCAKEYPSISITHEDFKADRKSFLSRIPTDHAQYRAACTAAGVSPIITSNAFDGLALLYGTYARLLVCRDPENTLSSAISLNIFTIAKGRRDDEAEITQETYDFEDHVPRGTVRIRGADTIEMRIDYGARHPLGVFMAPLPRGATINAILAMTLDIKYHTRLVAARPVLFIRIEKDKSNLYQDFYRPKTKIYRAVKAFLESSVELNADKWEMIPQSLHEQAVAKVLTAVKEAASKNGRTPSKADGD